MQRLVDQRVIEREPLPGDATCRGGGEHRAIRLVAMPAVAKPAVAEIRPHFDERTRRVLVIGTMVALGQWDEFRLHVRAALAEGGFTPDDIKEILLQQAIYCGVPAANHAVKEAGAIVQELGLLKG